MKAMGGDSGRQVSSPAAHTRLVHVEFDEGRPSKAAFAGSARECARVSTHAHACASPQLPHCLRSLPWSTCGPTHIGDPHMHALALARARAHTHTHTHNCDSTGPNPTHEPHRKRAMPPPPPPRRSLGNLRNIQGPAFLVCPLRRPSHRHGTGNCRIRFSPCNSGRLRTLKRPNFVGTWPTPQ